MKSLFWLAIGLLLLLPSNSLAESTSKKSMQDIAYRMAKEYKVPYALVEYMVAGESSWRPKALGDMNQTCKRTGKPIRARGILQLTECYWGHITDVCAFDVACALKVSLPLMAKKETCMREWSTCRRYYRNLALKNGKEYAGVYKTVY